MVLGVRHHRPPQKAGSDGCGTGLIITVFPPQQRAIVANCHKVTGMVANQAHIGGFRKKGDQGPLILFAMAGLDPRRSVDLFFNRQSNEANAILRFHTHQDRLTAAFFGHTHLFAQVFDGFDILTTY